MTLAGTPPTMEYSWTSLFTTAPDATTAPRPMVTPFKITALDPTQLSPANTTSWSFSGSFSSSQIEAIGRSRISILWSPVTTVTCGPKKTSLPNINFALVARMQACDPKLTLLPTMTFSLPEISQPTPILKPEPHEAKDAASNRALIESLKIEFNFRGTFKIIDASTCLGFCLAIKQPLTGTNAALHSSIYKESLRPQYPNNP